MDIREIPRLVFEQMATQVGPARTQSLSGQAVAQVGQTEGRHWLRYEDDGPAIGYSNNTHVTLFIEVGDAHNPESGFRSFGGIHAGITHTRTCYEHTDCTLLEPRIWVSVGYLADRGFLDDIAIVVAEFARLVAVAQQIRDEHVIDTGSTCVTRQNQDLTALPFVNL